MATVPTGRRSRVRRDSVRIVCRRVRVRRPDLPTGSETMPTGSDGQGDRATADRFGTVTRRQSPPTVTPTGSDNRRHHAADGDRRRGNRRQVRAKRTATARRDVPAVRTGSPPSRSAAAPCAVPVAFPWRSADRRNRSPWQPFAVPPCIRIHEHCIRIHEHCIRIHEHSPPTVTGAPADGSGVPIFRRVRTRTGSPWRSADGDRQRGNRSDGQPPTGSRQTRRNRPPWRSRRSDGFAPVPIRRAVPVAFPCAVATVTGSERSRVRTGQPWRQSAATAPTVRAFRSSDGHGNRATPTGSDGDRFGRGRVRKPRRR